MRGRCRGKLVFAVCAFWAACTLGTGCHGPQACLTADNQLPRELSKVSLPAYVIEPPDILLLDAVRLIPLPPYRIEPLDALIIQVSGPSGILLEGIYQVDPEGIVKLGTEYSNVRLQGKTLDEARKAIEDALKAAKIQDPKAQVSIAQARGLQQLRGEHLVRPDGTIGLGTYGSVYITGMTVPEAKAAIEQHMGQFLLKPEVSLDILAYNSKVFYIIFDGAGYGQQLVRLPVTGNETVLDAIAQVNGLPAQASKQHIWVARPAPAKPGCAKGEGDQILPVNWNAITQCAQTATNYQVLPGDRIFVKADALIATDNWISKVAAPIERIFGLGLLGETTVRTFKGSSNSSNSNSGNGGL